MLVSKRSQYALRAIFELAWQNSIAPAKIQVIAEAQNIPPRFLEVILNELRHGGIVESRRGKDGGYLLAARADKLTIGRILMYLQGPVTVVTGKSQNSQNGQGQVEAGQTIGDFAFGQLWGKLVDAVSQVLESTTLADLVGLEKDRMDEYVPNYAI